MMKPGLHVATELCAVGCSMDQIPKSGFGIRRTHQNLAYQETAETERLKMTQRLWVLQSALANHDSVGRSFANKMLAGFQRNFKGLEIAVVHSDDPGARIQRTTHINGCMHLNERVESELVLRDFAQITEHHVIQCRDD